MIKQLTYFLIMFLGITTNLFAQKLNGLRYEDAIYEANIKTVAVYPAPVQLQDPARTTYPPVVSLDSNTPLIAEFDDLSARFRSFRYKVFHCNADWTPSNLNDIEFTYEYNDYPINDYQSSFNTKVPYFHYVFELPKLKLPGNYVVAVYEDKRPAKLVLSRRFMVYQARVNVSPQVRLSTGIAEQRTHQQIDFDIEYKGYELLSPQDDLKIVIRQNFRWDKVLTKLRPTNVRAFDYRLEYRPFDLSNNILGGNEFRWFDTRLSRAVGMSVNDIEQLPDQTIVRLHKDASRLAGGANFQAQDLNGQYIVLNRDAANSSNEADYLNVVFTLQSPLYPNAQVYVGGAFNLWQHDDASRMTYNNSSGAYEASMYIKQGVVNYCYYALKGDGQMDDVSFEGSFSNTANDYEIFVYHRPPAARADQLVGYRLIEYGRR
ncbi:DUF5103 domain-containing protein [Runella sp. MFBS21]|uniref:type IX secretion system plug protein n=1 Tax=Runella sp. MFBS21 TaxID=3034018 RepID=UPI0023F6A9AE|nr:DUF5103 domain-containing protein [Runella sp. MFBS21]MDF7817837.1 DUF5103 domain-containing protein [Runella sp. MFBS21]